MASLIRFSLKEYTKVFTGKRSSGAVAIIDRSFNSVSVKFNDLGMGVADRLIISTSSFKDLIFSF